MPGVNKALDDKHRWNHSLFMAISRILDMMPAGRGGVGDAAAATRVVGWYLCASCTRASEEKGGKEGSASQLTSQLHDGRGAMLSLCARDGTARVARLLGGRPRPWRPNGRPVWKEPGQRGRVGGPIVGSARRSSGCALGRGGRGGRGRGEAMRELFMPQTLLLWPRDHDDDERGNRPALLRADPSLSSADRSSPVSLRGRNGRSVTRPASQAMASRGRYGFATVTNTDGNPTQLPLQPLGTTHHRKLVSIKPRGSSQELLPCSESHERGRGA